MKLPDQGGAPLSFLSERLLDALRAAGDTGLSLEAQDALGVPQLGWRVNELHRHGHLVGETDGTLFLVHDATSTDAPAAAAGTPPPGLSSSAGASVDAAPRLFDPVSTAVSGPGGVSLSPGTAPGAAVDAGREAA